ncbi:unnamed protein product [Prunus brigantina]
MSALSCATESFACATICATKFCVTTHVFVAQKPYFLRDENVIRRAKSFFYISAICHCRGRLLHFSTISIFPLCCDTML